MHSILSWLNSGIDTLNHISPVWYTVVVAPIASLAQHALKKEREYSKRMNVAIWLTLSAVGGGLYSVAQAGTFNQFLNHFATLYPAIALTANLTYRAVFQKYEQLNAVGALTEPAATTTAPTGVETVSDSDF